MVPTQRNATGSLLVIILLLGGGAALGACSSDETGTACTSDAACDLVLGEVGACERAACVDSICRAVPVTDGQACSGDDRCIQGSTCQDGACLGGTPRTCGDDGNSCTVATACDPATGFCGQEVLKGACDDGDACTTGDVCTDGVCVGQPMVCDDDNPCTVGDRCVAGDCVPGPVEPCDDGNGCTVSDACDPASGFCLGQTTAACACSELADCAVHDDGNLCNGTLNCVADNCTVDFGTVVECGETSECEVSECNPDTGRCEGTPVVAGTPCGAASACQVGACDGAGTCVETPLDCSDGNPCTADSCTAGRCRYAYQDACACSGDGCAPDGEPGDALVLGPYIGQVVETVEVEIIDGFAVTCGGFGLDVFRVDPSGTLGRVSGTLSRCQNVAEGPLVGGFRMVYASHHGDAYVPRPGVFTLSMNVESGSITTTGPTVGQTGISFEGLEVDPDGMLWVAAHASGLFRYAIEDNGSLSAFDTIDGFDNAWRLATTRSQVYVADGEGGLKVVDRVTGSIVGAAPTVAHASDVVVTGPMALVAVSSLGVQAFDVSEPTDPRSLGVVFTDGTALTLEFIDPTRLAVANWNDVVVIDTSHPDALKVLASDRGITATRPWNDPRNLGIAAEGTTLVAADWLGLGQMTWNEGLIAPEVHVDRAVIQLGGIAPGSEATETFEISNRGWLDLDVTNVVVDNPTDWSVEPNAFVLGPGESRPVTLTFHPTGVGTVANGLRIESNDPDEVAIEVPLLGNPLSSDLDVGDALTPAFDFLDVDSSPESRSIENLRGHVLVLAYFATF